jgi:hypothetical protein
MGVSYLPLGQPAGKYLLCKISNGGQGQHSMYLAFWAVVNVKKNCTHGQLKGYVIVMYSTGYLMIKYMVTKQNSTQAAVLFLFYCPHCYVVLMNCKYGMPRIVDIHCL